MINQTAYSTVIISNKAEDPIWDQFLEQTPGGHHVQTSLWSQLKETLGWQVCRILMMENEKIIGGAQILMRSIFAGWKVAYITKGPLLIKEDDGIIDAFLQKLRDVMQKERILALIMQPPDNDTLFSSLLPQYGFAPSPITPGTAATVKVNLSLTENEIMANMKSKTRYNVRLGARKGVTVEKGVRQDLPHFHELLSSTAIRQGFTPYSLSYFEKMWDLFEPDGYLQLFFTCFEGKRLTTNLSITFGDTVIYKKGAWSGQESRVHPNEVMHWDVIRWCKEHGFNYYDFEGIELEAAHCVINNQPLPEALKRTPTRFKLNFNNNPSILPTALIYFGNPILRWGFRVVYPWVDSRIPIKNLLLRWRAR